MPCPEGCPEGHKSHPVDANEKDSGGSPYEKLMHSLHYDPKWSQEVNLGRRVGLYKFCGELGCGNFSQVKLAVHQLTKERVAVKIVDKGMLDDKMIRMLNQEISTMESMHHPNLIRLYEVVETYSKLYLVMEYASGGELYNKVTTVGKLEEMVARNLFAQICSAVNHMHERHIIHRDIKAENVFFSSPNRVKLGDFGFSAKLTEGTNQRLNTFCGSPPYAAPELFCEENYVGGPVDVWALGILLYFMVVGRMPFKGQNVPTLKTNILAGAYHVPKYLSKECADLIEGVIQQNPVDRLTISSILSSDWLKGINLPVSAPTEHTFYMVPTVRKVKTDETENVLYSTIEQNARERLNDLGITSQLLEAQCAQGSRSHIIGAYRIVVHRIQKQLSSFVDVDGCLPLNNLSSNDHIKGINKKSDKNHKFGTNNVLVSGKESPKLLLNCWRRKSSSDDTYDLDGRDSSREPQPEGASITTKEKKEKLILFHKRVSQSAAKNGRTEGHSADSTIVRSTACVVL